jgi:hypothetical protein
MPILIGVPVGALLDDAPLWPGGELAAEFAAVLLLLLLPPLQAARTAAMIAATTIPTIRADLRGPFPNDIAPLP